MKKFAVISDVVKLVSSDFSDLIQCELVSMSKLSKHLAL